MQRSKKMTRPTYRILVTGANGFIGKNLVLRLREQAGTEVLTYVRGQDDAALLRVLEQCDAVVHLAGENRPVDVQAFFDVNTALTERVCQALKALGKTIPLIWPRLPKLNWVTHMG